MISAQKSPKSQNLAKKDDENGKVEWQAGLQLFFELSGWLVAPLIIALFLGRWLDNQYQTKPWLFLLTTAVAFAITCLGIVLKTIQFIKQTENSQNKKTETKSNNSEVNKQDNEKQ